MKSVLGLLIALAPVLATVSAQAATVGNCDGLDSIAMMVGNAKTFASGGVKVAHVSTEEPAAASDHILVFAFKDDGDVSCVSINHGPAQEGFGSIDFDKMVSKYSSATGLVLQVPAQVPNIDGRTNKTEMVTIRIDRSNLNFPVITAK